MQKVHFSPVLGCLKLGGELIISYSSSYSCFPPTTAGRDIIYIIVTFKRQQWQNLLTLEFWKPWMVSERQWLAPSAWICLDLPGFQPATMVIWSVIPALGKYCLIQSDPHHYGEKEYKSFWWIRFFHEAGQGSSSTSLV